MALCIQLAYSPDIHLFYFNCLRLLEVAIKGDRYHDWDEVETALKNVIQSGLSSGVYQRVKKLPEQWELVIMKESNYI